MKGAIQILICAWALSPVVHADVQTNAGPQSQGYRRIVEINPFKLIPEVPPPSVPAIPTGNPSDLKLTGIADSGGKKSAYFMLEERGKSPRYISVAEGNAGDGLEVVAIDIQAETVRLRRNGVSLVLSLKTDDVKSADQLRRAEKHFVDEHGRAHELHQQRERARIERERALAEAELKVRAERELEVAIERALIPGGVKAQEQEHAAGANP